MKSSRDLFWELLEPQYLGAMMFCRKLMGDRDSGDDLYQDALVIAYTKFSDLRDRAAFRPWLYRILVNTFHSTVRRSWWKVRVSNASPEELSLSVTNPIELLAARRWLERAFQAVSSQEQTLITLYELEEWTVAELAELYGKSEGSIKTRLLRARQKMRKALIRFSREAEMYQRAQNALSKEGKCAAAKPGLD
jgi:RNA polymerase sigma-70 factor (ECF subfamily)